MRHVIESKSLRLILITALSFVILLVSVTSAQPASLSCDTPVRIMPLGDSITVGRSSEVDDPALQVGYRKALYDRLISSGFNIDFVGSMSNGERYPDFDSNHEGHSGRSDKFIAENMYGFLSAHPADIILLHIGTNQLDPSPDDVEDILNEIDRWEADNSQPITVILARIIDWSPNNPRVTEFNNRIQAMAQDRINDALILVDMQNGAGINYALVSDGGDMWNRLHPYRTGYDRMAQVWHDALVSLLPRCLVDVAIQSSPVDGSMVGESYTYAVNATGNPAPTYSLVGTPPSGMSIDPNTGVVSWIPSLGGTYSVTVRADNDFTSDEQAFTIEVLSVLITGSPVLTAKTGLPYTYDVDAIAHPAPTYELVGAPPDGMSIDDVTGLLSWTPTAAGDYPVTVRVFTTSGSAEQSFTISVSEPETCPANLAGYWKLDEEDGASTFADETGAHPGTCGGSGCPVATAGVFSRAQQFDGENEEIVINIPDSATDTDPFDWAGSDSFTLETWFNMPSTSTCNGNELLVGRSGQDTAIWLWCASTSANISFYLRDNARSASVSVESGTSFNDGLWHHAAAVWDGESGEARLYIDGVLTGSQSASFTGDFFSDGQITIGNYNSDFHLTGSLDEVAFHTQALTAEEIAAHYNGGEGCQLQN